MAKGVYSGLRAAFRSGKLSKDEMKKLLAAIIKNSEMDTINSTEEIDKIRSDPKPYYKKVVGSSGPSITTKTSKPPYKKKGGK